MKQLELFSDKELQKISFEDVKVLKRDGREVLFDVERIYNAIEKAFRSTFSGGDSSELIMKSLKIGGLVLEEFRKRVKEGEKNLYC